MSDTAPLPLLVLPEYVLLPGTLVPFHATEPEPCRLFGAALADRRLVVVASGAAAGIGALGRIVSDRRYPDGRIDVFVHGLERVRVTSVESSPDGPRAHVETEPDDGLPETRAACERLRSVTFALVIVLGDGVRAEEGEALRSVLASASECGLFANRLGSFVLVDFHERQALLETRCAVTRADWLTRRVGDVLLEAAPDEPVH